MAALPRRPTIPQIEQRRLPRGAPAGSAGVASAEGRRAGPVLAGQAAEPAAARGGGVDVDVRALVVGADADAAGVGGEVVAQREGGGGPGALRVLRPTPEPSDMVARRLVAAGE
jgi:hypothetical protein